MLSEPSAEDMRPSFLTHTEVTVLSVDVNSCCVTHCNMTPNRLWKTSMSMTVLWIDMTVYKRQSEQTKCQQYTLKHLFLVNRDNLYSLHTH